MNIIGGFAMGLIVELSALKLNLSPELRAFLTTGILGGFTTFSAFSLDSALLDRARRVGRRRLVHGGLRRAVGGRAVRRALAGSFVRMSATAEVEKDEAGLRLDRWFKRHYPALTHGHLEKLLRTGQVRIDGKRAKSGDRLEAGQAIRLPPQINSISPPPQQARPARTLGDADKAFIQKPCHPRGCIDSSC